MPEERLEKKELNELIRKAQNGSTKAMNKVLMHNMKLAISFTSNIFRKYAMKHGGIIEDVDILQEAFLGMRKAVKDYNFTSEFTTYVYYIMRIHVNEFLRNNMTNVWLPYAKRKTLMNILRMINNETDNVDVICKKLKITKKNYYGCMEAINPVRLDALYEDTIPEIKKSNDIEERDYMEKLLEGLPKDDKRLIDMRYFKDKQNKFKTIGKSLRYSLKDIYQKHSRVLAELKEKAARI